MMISEYKGMSLGHCLLNPHPASLPLDVQSVGCSINWEHAGRCVLDFIVGGPPEALALPDAAEPVRADELWRTTCFELFLRRPGSEGYLEFNFSPSGQWAAYAFDGYRAGRRNLEIAPILILGPVSGQAALAWETHLLRQGHEAEFARKISKPFDHPAGPVAQFALGVTFDDPGLGDGAPWLAGLSAVIEEAQGALSYWALAHPSDKPDFHHPDSFVLDLP